MLERIKQDKWKHFFVGIGLGVLFEALALRFLPRHLLTGSFIAFSMIVIIAYGFEVLSLVIKRGHYDVMDAVASVIGGVIGMAIPLLVQMA